MVVSLIVAMTSERVIGSHGTIPWRIREETALFRQLTTGHAVIMGRGTWLSLPEASRPLKDRLNIIVSSTMRMADGAVVCSSIADAISEGRKRPGEIFCIGGAKLYSGMLPFSDRLHISIVDGSYAGDAYFPNIDYSEWREVSSRQFKDFRYSEYARRERPG